MKNFNELPAELQERIKNYLKCYDKVDVFYENGEYSFTVAIKSSYAPDRKYIGKYYAKDIYTEEERIVNYVNEFRSYPIQYKGKKDYLMLKDDAATFIMVDGNIEKA